MNPFFADSLFVISSVCSSAFFVFASKIKVVNTDITAGPAGTPGTLTAQLRLAEWLARFKVSKGEKKLSPLFSTSYVWYSSIIDNNYFQ